MIEPMSQNTDAVQVVGLQDIDFGTDEDVLDGPTRTARLSPQRGEGRLGWRLLIELELLAALATTLV